MAFNGAYRRRTTSVWSCMISKITLVVFTSSLFAQQTNWIAAGHHALDNGKPEEAAADFAQALNAHVRAGASAKDLLHLRVTLATAYMEAGAYRDMEAVLQDAQKAANQLTDGVSRAELLNAWSALHLKQGKLSAAEAELLEARQIVMQLPEPGDLLTTVLHNLAALEMRTGRYADALCDELAAIRRLEKTLAPDHPTLIRGWASLASLQYMLGKPQEAKVSMERALASAEKTYGPEHAFVADLLESDAVVLDKLKLNREAKRARDRVRKIRGMEAAGDPDRLTWSVREPLTADGQVYLRSK
jgi:tetratricopeptide (TPR) repeat protein